MVLHFTLIWFPLPNQDSLLLCFTKWRRFGQALLYTFSSFFLRDFLPGYSSRKEIRCIPLPSPCGVITPLHPPYLPQLLSLCWKLRPAPSFHCDSKILGVQRIGDPRLRSATKRYLHDIKAKLHVLFGKKNPTSFLQRAERLEELCRRLASDHAKLVTKFVPLSKKLSADS